ncbi:MAG: hypothetical protein ABFS28_03390 [Bacteroidota bacterium]
MSNVDLIIKYLSGEMNLQEAGSFEKELASKQGLKDEFDQVSAAYKLIRDQLQLRDEVEFQKLLLEVMEHPATGKQQGGRRLHKLWYYLMPLAASLAVILAIFLSQKDGEKLFSKYYHPEKDRVILAYNQGTRGKAESGILHYQHGNYQETLDIMWEIIEQDQENLLAQLYFLLSSIETGKQDQAIAKLAALNPDMDHQLGQAIYWYTTLAFIKSDRLDDAGTYLHSLIQQQGPYQSDARRLEKILLK